MSTASPSPGTVQRSFDVIELFTDARPQLSAAEISVLLAVNRSTVGRWLGVFEQHEMLERVGPDPVYRLGPAWARLGALARRHNPLHRLAGPEMDSLVAYAGQTASVDILEGSETRMVAESKGGQVHFEPSSIGGRWPAHASSTGKVLMAFLPAQARARILSEDLRPLTEQTLTDPKALTGQCREIRARGWGLAHQELEIGYSDLSVPVRDDRGQIVAALSLGGASMIFSDDTVANWLSELIPAADRLSHQLGWRPELNLAVD